MHYFYVVLQSDVIWAFGPTVTRRVTYTFLNMDDVCYEFKVLCW